MYINKNISKCDFRSFSNKRFLALKKRLFENIRFLNTF